MSYGLILRCLLVSFVLLMLWEAYFEKYMVNICIRKVLKKRKTFHTFKCRLFDYENLLSGFVFCSWKDSKKITLFVCNTQIVTASSQR